MIDVVEEPDNIDVDQPFHPGPDGADRFQRRVA